MDQYRFSPIKDEDKLLEAITYLHFACFSLCKQAFGKYLPNAGNIGIFSHSEAEFTFLTKLRESLTQTEDNINNKYYRLHQPITIPAKGDVPETTYTYLYIRKPESDHPQVGDVDFYMEPPQYLKLKEELLQGKIMPGAQIFAKPGYDYIELSEPEGDIEGFVGTNNYK
jgi:hypothetical protein